MSGVYCIAFERCFMCVRRFIFSVTRVFFRFSQAIFQHPVLKTVVLRTRPMNIQRPLPTPVRICDPWVAVAIPPGRLLVIVQIAFPSAVGIPGVATKVAITWHSYARPSLYPSPGNTRRTSFIYFFSLSHRPIWPRHLSVGRGNAHVPTATGRPIGNNKLKR